MASPQPQLCVRTLTYQGRMDLFTTIQKFGGRMPMSAECDRMAHSPPPAISQNRNALPARRGFLLAYPPRRGPFPGLFEFRDQQNGNTLCMDTRNWKGIHGIALLLEPGTYDFRWDGRRMHIIPASDPLMIDAFPQDPGWHPYHPDTKIPVIVGGTTDSSGTERKRFIHRTDGLWFGMPSMEINCGNWDEKRVKAISRPSLPQAVFTWEAEPPRPAWRAPHASPGRIISIPAPTGNQNPAEGAAKKAPAAESRRPAYFEALYEWQVRAALHELDRACPYPGPAPRPEEYSSSRKGGKA